MATVTKQVADNGSAAELIEKCIKAYRARDKETVDSLLSEDMTFTSPYDDHIDKKTYFEKCWDGGDTFASMEIRNISGEGNRAFIRYDIETKDGKKFSNTEFITSENGKIKTIEVYFGRTESEGAGAEPEILAILENIGEGVRAKKASQMAKDYAEDIIAFDVVDPLQYTGKEEVQARSEQWLSQFPGSVDFEMADINISVDGDVAFSSALDHVKGNTHDGNEVDMWWRATTGFKKIGGVWKIVHIHSSVPFNPETGKPSTGLKP